MAFPKSSYKRSHSQNHLTSDRIPKIILQAIALPKITLQAIALPKITLQAITIFTISDRYHNRTVKF
ncbi:MULTISPECIES: hypothetical protein [Nostocales]|uniref:Uncharacterized protein n=1 Tax=Dolichospermum flos-aquae UHCC 0037 TaxID=2590026 RepID=A0ACC7S6D9_DOLFA|nr:MULTISPECIES: hypothetical protein [Nostocales]MBO1064699.1 hypothetical protein [Anabaena sp. 54]MTJ44062.1 hypothetical protein [Dolichospermum flos-aquae UHCC 0037]